VDADMMNGRLKAALVGAGWAGVWGVFVLGGCGTGVGPVGTPELPDFQDVDPATARLNVDKKRTEPFVFGLSEMDRTAMETAFKHGAAIVRFDKEGFEILTDCRATGAYDYNGVSPKEKLTVFRSKAELYANLPVGAASLEGELRSEGQVRLQIFVVGQHSLAGEVKREQLTGSCSGATHVVRRATIGAFKRIRAASRSGGASVSGFGASASGSGAGDAFEGATDGDYQSCNGADPDAPKAPARCRSVIQLVLIPLDGENKTPVIVAGGPGAPKVEERPECADGMVWDGSACVVAARVEAEQRAARDAGKPAESVASYECDPQKVQECVTQCKAGNMGSCVTLGYHLLQGNQVPKDEARALKLWEQVCKRNEGKGCGALNVHFAAKQDWRRALVYGAAGCKAGDAGSCTNLGVQAFLGQGVPKSNEKALGLWLRACKLRDQTACSNAGVMVLHGLGGATKDPGKARLLFERACTDATKEGCANLAETFELGLGGGKDLARALKLYIERCEAGEPSACIGAGQLIEASTQNPDSLRKALGFYDRGCQAQAGGTCMSEAELRPSYGSLLSDEGYDRRTCEGASSVALACYNAGVATERGFSGSIDTSKASGYLKQACDAGLKKACRAPKPGNPRRM
jgi:uncharacterized protein